MASQNQDQDYLNFELNVEAFENNRLRVTVQESPVGSVSADLINSFTADEIARMIGVLENSVQATRTEKARMARAFGEKLFNTIFSGQIYAAYLASQERAGANGLRIRLSTEDAGLLEDIPWELLRDPRTDYLVLSRQTPVIRYPRLLTVRTLPAISLPLRVLVMISSPGDQEPLDVEAEWNGLQEATAELRRSGLLVLDRLDDAQLITLQRKLRSGSQYHVFHYIGHATFDTASQSGLLAFEHPKSDETVPVSGEALARELSEESSIRLVVMNACHAARQNNKDPFAGIASSIVARGVPAVVAMQFTVSDEASRVFSSEFYRTLSEGYSIEAAVAESRRAISGSVNNLEWATPVLYLRAQTGFLVPQRPTKNKISQTASATPEKEPAFSTGGLSELLATPRGVLTILAGVIVLGLLAFLVFRPVQPPGQVTPTVTLDETRDVDLVVDRLRFLPPNPAPGERVTVALVLRNTGTTDSGPFKWAWYASNPQESQTPTIQDEVENLGAGQTLFVKGEFTFGWWGNYITTAWVNFDNKPAPETNPLNNLIVRSVTTSNNPFVIDFTLLPDGSPVVEPRELGGNEFTTWNFQLAPVPGSNTGCAEAIIRINVIDNVNRLGTSLAGQPTTCTSLPIVFQLNQPVGAVAVEFFADVNGPYKLELFDADDKKKLPTEGTINATAGQIVSIRVPATGSGLSDIRKAVFSGPANSKVSIQRISFSIINAPLAAPTSTP